jgi:FkbM family methyltransferase
VATDEGELWAIERDRVITPILQDQHTWDQEMTKCLSTHVRPGMTAIDVGANIGYVSRTLSRMVGSSGYLIALEPEPLNFRFLCANLAEVRHDRLQCIRAAASNQNAMVSLWLDENNLGDHRTWGAGRENGRHISVPAVRLDDLVDESVQVDVVKVDTQGSDHFVVAGMERLIAHSHPIVYVEFWPFGIEGFGAKSLDVLAGYRALGMEIGVVQEDGRLYPSDDELLSRTLAAPGGFIDLMLRPS